MGHIADLAQQTAGGVIGAGMGLLLGKYNDNRQIKQQQKLTDMQVKAQQGMIDYGKAADLKMWKDTNYKPQVEELEKAGLNPGLIYGMGGAGGATTGGSGGGVSGGSAAAHSNEVMQMGQMGMQLQLMKAQKENIEADTQNKRTGAGYTGGALTEATNAGAAATRTATKGQELSNTLAAGSMSDNLQKISAEAVQEIQKAQQQVNNTTVSTATIQDQIKQIQQNAIGKVLDNTLARIEQTVKNVNIGKARAEIKAIAEYVEQGWRKTSQGERTVQQGWDSINIQKNKNEIMERLGKAGLDLQEQQQALNAIMGVMGMGTNIIPKTTQQSWWSEDNQGNWQQGHSTQKR
ncbi:MAG: DNA pilot protein [Microviridae sp.]|nr:MAG: DNA pilot protein [Microviridae sp.]